MVSSNHSASYPDQVVVLDQNGRVSELTFDLSVRPHSFRPASKDRVHELDGGFQLPPWSFC